MLWFLHIKDFFELHFFFIKTIDSGLFYQNISRYVQFEMNHLLNIDVSLNFGVDNLEDIFWYSVFFYLFLKSSNIFLTFMLHNWSKRKSAFFVLYKKMEKISPKKNDQMFLAFFMLLHKITINEKRCDRCLRSSEYSNVDSSDDETD